MASVRFGGGGFPKPPSCLAKGYLLGKGRGHFVYREP